MTDRKIMCVKFGKELPGLQKPPFPGPIGQQIFEKVSEQAWKSWKEDIQIKVLNEYRLNMSDPADYQKLVHQMMLYLNLESGDAAEVENADRGRKGS